MKVSRSSRLNGEYQKEISEIIRTRLKDKEPALSGIISVTEADVAPDLKTAKIYISIFAKDEAEKLRPFDIISENAGFIRHELSQVMRMRTVPALTFLWDGSMAYGAKMDELFKKIHDSEETVSYTHLLVELDPERGTIEFKAIQHVVSEEMCIRDSPMLVARRLVVHSAEDVGMADPRALQIATSAMYAFEKIGYPEGLIPLSEAIIYVCEAEKSYSVKNAMLAAKDDASRRCV